MFRGDLLTAGCGVDGCCAFKIPLMGNVADHIGRQISVRQAETNICIGGGPLGQCTLQSESLRISLTVACLEFGPSSGAFKAA